MIPSDKISFELTEQDVRDFWQRMPERHRRFVMISLKPEQRLPALLAAIASSPLAAMARDILAWLEPIPASGLATIHIATTTASQSILGPARAYLPACHRLYPWLICSIPLAFRQIVPALVALSFRQLCVIPQATYLERAHKYVSARLFLHGQEA